MTDEPEKFTEALRSIVRKKLELCASEYGSVVIDKALDKEGLKRLNDADEDQIVRLLDHANMLLRSAFWTDAEISNGFRDERTGEDMERIRAQRDRLAELRAMAKNGGRLQ